VPKSGSLGSARGALSNGRPYREHHGYVAVRPEAVAPPNRPTSGADAIAVIPRWRYEASWG
jgi:hypothetical protein